MDRSWRCVVWPPRSPDLYPADYQVWGCMKAMAYARKVHTTGELPWRNLRAARCSNKGSVATLVRKCIQTDGGLLNSLYAQLTTELELCCQQTSSIKTKCFPFSSSSSDLRKHSQLCRLYESDPRVYGISD